MFSEHKPLYFILDHEGENFYLNSCLALSAQNYIWYQLKKSNMEHIFFIEKNANDSVRICVLDPLSFQKNTYDSGSFLSKKKPLWNVKKENPQKDFKVTVSAEVAARWMLERISENDTAVVAGLDALKCLFPTAEEERAFIQEISEGKGTLVIDYPMTPGREQLELLVGEDSIFRKEAEGRSLFKPLYALLESGDSSAAVFDELKKSVPDQCLEIGYIDFESVKVLIKNIGFALKRDFTEREFYDHVNYLFYWLEKEPVRRDSRGLFGSVKGAVTRKKLFQALASGGFPAFEERQEMLRKIYRSKHPDAKSYVPMSEILFELYGRKNTANTKSHVFISNPALEKLCGTSFPIRNGSYTSEFEILQVSENEWDEMRYFLKKPRNICFDEEKTKWMQGILSYIEPAKACGDTDTLRRAVNMLMYCGNNFYSASVFEYSDYCKRGKQYLDLSKEYFSLKKNVIKLNEGLRSGTLTSMAEAALKAEEAKLYKYHTILKDLDTIFVQIQKTVMDIAGWEFGNSLGIHEEMTGFSSEKQEIDREIDSMSEEEMIGFIENEL